jgi:hypothetical protein
MFKFRYSFSRDWLFYILVIGYGCLVTSMTAKLWFGDGVNIFAAYSDATEAAKFIVDANKVYWAKTNFLFASILLYALNFDYRAAVGLGVTLWSIVLIVMFESSPVILVSLVTGIALVAQQAWRKQLWNRATNDTEE